MADEKKIIEIEFKAGEASKRLKELQVSLNQNKNAVKELNNSYKNGEKTLEEYSNEQVKLTAESKEIRREQAKLFKELELINKVNTENAITYNELTAELRLQERTLKDLEGTLKRNADGTLELSEEYKQQFEEVKKLRQAQLDFDGAIKRTQTNVGNYEESINKALSGFVPFTVETEGFAEFLKNPFKSALTLAINLFSSLGAVIKGNPILLLAGLLAGAVSAFSKTNEGADQLAGIFARLNDIARPFLQILESLGAVVLPIIEAILDLASVLLGLFGVATENTAEYAKQLSFVDRELEEIERKNRILLAQEEALKNIRDNEARSLQARLKANEELGKSIEQRLKSEIEGQEKKLNLLKEERNAINGNRKELKDFDLVAQAAIKNRANQIFQTRELILLEKEKGRAAAEEEAIRRSILEAQGKSAELEKLNVEIQEQEATLADKKAEILGVQNEQITNQVSILNEIKDIEIELNELGLKRALLQGKIKEGSQEELKLKLENNEKIAKAELIAIVKQNQRLLEQNKFRLNLEKATAREIIQQLNFIDSLRERSNLERITDANQLLKISENLAISDLEVTKEFNEKQKQEAEKRRAQIEANQKKAAENRKKILEEQNRAEIARLKLAVINSEEFTNERLSAELELIEGQNKIKLQNEKLTANERRLIRAQELEQIEALVKKFNDKDLQEAKKKEDGLFALEQFRLKERIKNLGLFLEEAKKINNEELINDSLTTEEKLNKITEFSQKSIDLLNQQKETEIQIEKDKQERILNNEALTEEERALLIEQSNSRINDITRNFETARTDITKTEADKRTKILALQDKEVTDFLQNTANAAGQIAGLFEENTIAYKAFATTEAIVSSYLAANKALASAPPPFSFILAGTTLAQGLANVAKINGLYTGGVIQEYNGGGRVRGGGSSKSDSIPARLSAGESVINAKSTRAFLPVLSAINQAGGGVPLTAQSGAFVSSPDITPIQNISSGIVSDFAALETTVNAIKELQIFTRITEVNEVQEKVQNTVNIADS